jgi:peptide deformylase
MPSPFPPTPTPSPCAQRPRDITVRAQNEKGEAVTLSLGGPDDEGMWLSRIFQHEYDHLNGTLFHDRMSRPVLESVRAKLVALEEGFVKEHPGVAVQRIKAKAKGF